MAPSANSNDSVNPPPGKPTRIEDRLFINGEFVPSISGKKFDVYNPTTEQVSASVYEAGAEDVEEAVKAAKAAFPSWSNLSAAERGAYLSKLADAIDRVLPEIGYLEAVTMGRPYIPDRKFL
jgi:aldehyde dehydrogenase (NAD+)